MQEQNNKNEIEFLNKAYNALYETKKEKIELEYLIKQTELDLKTSYASVKDLRKKDGEVDPKMVKSDLLKLAIKLTENDDENQENPIETKLDTLIEYIKDIREGKMEKELINSFVTKTESLKELKSDLKNLKGEYAGLIDKEENLAVDVITDRKIISYKEEKEEKFRKENGLAEKKPRKSKEEKESSLEEVIQTVAKKLNISI